MTMAIAAITLLSTTAFAQDNKQVCSGQNPAECCNQKGDQPCMQMLLFNGIQLTNDQKDKLKAIPTPAKAKKDRDCKAKENRRAAAQEDRANYLKSVKAVLTPEQYTQFLENSFVYAPAHKHGRKGDAPKCNGHRFDGKQRPAATKAK